MTDAARKLLEGVLALPESDRAQFASALLASLGPGAAGDEDGWQEAWLAELERRGAHSDGTAVEWAVVRDGTLKSLDSKG